MTPRSDSAPDRFTLELIKGALNAARAEMEALVARTAMSPFIREKKDYFTAFLNPKGELVVSTSLTLAGNLVDAILDEYPAQTMRAGDLYWYNDCYGTRGAVSHLPDMAFVMPVFHEGRLIAFAEAWGHLWDVGGSVPGSISPFATSVFQEGIMIPPVRVMREGVENEEVVEAFVERRRDFVVDDAAGQVPDGARTMTSGPCFLALPHRHDTDGFFAARMRRLPAAA